jgi:hypothetical protein
MTAPGYVLFSVVVFEGSGVPWCGRTQHCHGSGSGSWGPKRVLLPTPPRAVQFEMLEMHVDHIFLNNPRLI